MDDTTETTAETAEEVIPATPNDAPVSTRKRRPITTVITDEASQPATPRKTTVKTRKPPTRKKAVGPPKRSKKINPDSRRGYKYDWPVHKRQFVEGILPEGDEPTSESREFVTLKELASRVNVPYDAMRARAADERWYDLRQDYQLRLSKARQQKRIAELSKESFEFDQNTLKVAKLGMGMITARMSEIAREVQEAKTKRDEAIALMKSGYPVDDLSVLGTVIDARELNTLAGAAVSWQLLGQKALGTDITRMEIQHDIQASLDVDVNVTTIAAELGRDDPDRLAAFLQAAKRSGLLEVVMRGDEDEPPKELQPGDVDSDGIIEAEIVEESA